jgi:multimeric flavodoxin WrbA
MKIIGVNGSPRKAWNTGMLVENALAGAVSRGAETELVELYDMRFRGCISCFECKRKNGPGLGFCALSDELLPVLKRIHLCDGLILGSPMYICEVTSSMRALIERLTFQYITYNSSRRSFLERRIPSVLIYTMNVGESILEKSGYSAKFRFYEDLFGSILGPAKTLLSTETLQTNDYSKFEMTLFDESARKKRREEVFPLDMKKAFELGAGLVDGASL